MFIALIFKTLYATVCLFVWKTLSGIRQGMEQSTKYQKHSPGIIPCATLGDGENGEIDRIFNSDCGIDESCENIVVDRVF